MQWALRVNEAHHRLKDPVRRAAYLCELNGQPIGAETNTAMPVPFLMQQLRWREALETATTPADIETLDEQPATEQHALLGQLAALIEGVVSAAGQSCARSMCDGEARHPGARQDPNPPLQLSSQLRVHCEAAGLVLRA